MVPPPLVHWLNGLLGLAGLELGIHCDSPSIASTITDWFTRTIWPAEFLLTITQKQSSLVIQDYWNVMKKMGFHNGTIQTIHSPEGGLLKSGK